MRAVFVLILAMFVCVLPSHALGGLNTNIVLGKEVKAFKGASEFCEANPVKCAAHQEVRLHWSVDLLAELDLVNTRVNHAIRLQKEPPGVDVWRDTDVEEGDCEDYALVKIRIFVEQRGLQRGALHMAIVLRDTKDDELHAILIVSTDNGDLVLDMNSDTISPWSEAPFVQWRMMQAADGKWYEIINAPRVGERVAAK